jgi:hypothetical protein
MTIDEVNQYFTEEKDKLQTKLRGDIEALKDQIQRDQMTWEDMLSSSVRADQKVTEFQGEMATLTVTNEAQSLRIENFDKEL